MRQIPGLNDLRVFECAARLQNFRQAAEELHLTHGAVSHRIRALEDQLSLSLFERKNGVTLTDAGRELYIVVKESLDQIAAAVTRITQSSSEKTSRLRLAVLPTFASRWLLPRLNDFYALHPDIALQIEASADLVDVGDKGVDVAIRFGSGTWKGLQSTLLLRDFYYPVASPAFLSQHKLNTPRDLFDVPLLAHAMRRGTGWSWDDYFLRLNIATKKPLHLTTFDDGNLVIQAAEQGMGVAFARHSVAHLGVMKRALVPVFQFAMRSPYHHYFVQSLEAHKTDTQQLLLQWLIAQVAQFDNDETRKQSKWEWLNDNE